MDPGIATTKKKKCWRCLFCFLFSKKEHIAESGPLGGQERERRTGDPHKQLGHEKGVKCARQKNQRTTGRAGRDFPRDQRLHRFRDAVSQGPRSQAAFQPGSARAALRACAGGICQDVLPSRAAKPSPPTLSHLPPPRTAGLSAQEAPPPSVLEPPPGLRAAAAPTPTPTPPHPTTLLRAARQAQPHPSLEEEELVSESGFRCERVFPTLVSWRASEGLESVFDCRCELCAHPERQGTPELSAPS